jgi:hypothetical protein
LRACANRPRFFTLPHSSQKIRVTKIRVNPQNPPKTRVTKIRVNPQKSAKNPRHENLRQPAKSAKIRVTICCESIS